VHELRTLQRDAEMVEVKELKSALLAVQADETHEARLSACVLQKADGVGVAVCTYDE